MLYGILHPIHRYLAIAMLLSGAFPHSGIAQERHQQRSSDYQGISTPQARINTYRMVEQPPSHPLHHECQRLASMSIPYRYGGTSLKSGMDCSAAVQHLYQLLGKSLPRTSEAQANHLARNQRLWRKRAEESDAIFLASLIPGDLVFWVNKSAPNHIKHVMVFIGLERDGRHAQFWGAQGTNIVGLTGSGVDFHHYRVGGSLRTEIAAFGRP